MYQETSVATVLLPFYNAAISLADALESVLHSFQCASLRPSIVAVNDGSTDGSTSIAQGISDRMCGVSVIDAEHGGLVHALNIGLCECRTEWVIRVDADDLVHPDFIGALISSLNSPFSIVASDRVEVDLLGHRHLREIDVDNIFSLTGAGLALPTAFIASAGAYTNMFWEEYDLYLRMSAHPDFSIIRVPRGLYEYKRTASSMTADLTVRQDGWKMLMNKWGDQKLHGAKIHPDWSQ